MKEYYKEGKWKDFSFDLSAYAGQVITLRLQVEPGPKHSPSFDYSYFSTPTLICGNASNESEVLNAWTGTRAYKALEGASLTALANRSDQGVVPGNLLPYENKIEKTSSGWNFVYEGADCTLVYEWRPETGTLDDFTCRVDGGRAFYPMKGGGVTFQPPGKGAEPVKGEGGRLRKAQLSSDGRWLKITWLYPVQGKEVPLTWRFGLLGKALRVQVNCEAPVVGHFSLGQVFGVDVRKRLLVPYLPFGNVDLLSFEKVYCCRYLDWTVSNSSRCPQGEATYLPTTKGERNPLFESGYVAVSPDIGEVLPNLPNPPSPYLKLLGDRIMLDIWGHHDNSYAGDAANLRLLKDNGVDHLAIIQHVWQRYGYDVKLPDHIPANPTWGGEEGMKTFGRTANACGYVWSVHENYIDFYPDAPSYDPKYRVLDSQGKPTKAWFNAGTGVQAFALKCNWARHFAEQNSPYIHKTYGTSAAYLDVTTCAPPWHQLDCDATQPGAAMERTKVKYYTDLYNYMRATHHGPLFGEGNLHAFWAGRCDGVEAQVAGKEDNSGLLDFDLLKLHPQMVNHGMGYYERWFRPGYGTQWGKDAASPEQVDKYRAQELSYGHAGFIGNRCTDNVQWVAKEHHLMHAVQRLYGTAKVTSIRYEVGGRLVTTSVALAANDLERKQIKYDSGLTLWVNWGKTPWQVEGYTLPQWGFLAKGPDTLVYTALLDGKYANWAECPEYCFADSRTYFNMPYRKRVDITPALEHFKYLGGNKVELTYAWKVNDKIDKSYYAFVHFVNPKATKEGIVFQQDHSPTTPPGEWRPGHTYLDGPYVIEIPEDEEYSYYDITIGLYNGHDRAPLQGVWEGNQRLLLGRLLITRKDGKITRVELDDLSRIKEEFAKNQVDFSAHLNPVGTTLDFGKVITDGSVKVEKYPDHLVVFPYPRERTFTVKLNLPALVKGATTATARVEALEALTRHNLGPVEIKRQGDWISFTAGQPKVGRFLVRW